MHDIRRIVQQSPVKSYSLDPIPAGIFMHVLNKLLPFITMICNKSLYDGMLPASQNFSVITPIIKKAGLDQDIAANYWPVFNLSSF